MTSPEENLVHPATAARPPRRRRRWVAIATVVALVLASALAAVLLTRRNAEPEAVLGPPRGDYAWLSGQWAGGEMNAARATAFGDWRGRPSDAALTYPERATFAEIKKSEWHIATFDGYPGRLVYGLPLLSMDPKEGGFSDVAAGRYDDVFAQVAKDLVAHDRGDAIVRLAWEANGPWYRWGATAQNADEFKAAFRHVVTLMRTTAPDLVFNFDVSCGTGLAGTTDRTAALTMLYPGDDVVDIIGCDVYDVWKTHAATPAEWQQALAPAGAVGLSDVVAFADQRNKQFSVPEWGLWKADDHGGGDNPFYIEQMHAFFREHSSRLAYEAYFDEPSDYIKASVWADQKQNPKASARYRELWSTAP